MGPSIDFTKDRATVGFNVENNPGGLVGFTRCYWSVSAGGSVKVYWSFCCPI